MWTKLVEKNFPNMISDHQFWSGSDVWIKRPHIINRKLLATEKIEAFSLFRSEIISNDTNLDNRFFRLITTFSNECYKYLNSKRLSIDNNSQVHEIRDKPLVFELRKLIPRYSDRFSDVKELVILDKLENSVVFWPNKKDVHNSKITPKFPYIIKLINNVLTLEIYEDSLIDNPTEQPSKDWLRTVVFPKVFKWCSNLPAVAVFPSLNLVAIRKYSEKYSYLKRKYGKKYVETWPESSDPSKYVYEDLAIAAYLMTLWENERDTCNLTSKQSFVDLGCGNGLLVDILTAEGHLGIGIDVRRRKIWDVYDSHTKLIEKAIEPSDYHIFPDYDWIIGNHSDELTPWIPVIAARSSYKMKVFLLPCCLYTFNGKYERCNSGQTQYQSYLSFIQFVCQSMGFEVEKDKLRIPSTKRICFVCKSRTYREEEEENIDIVRKEFINSHSRRRDKCSISSTTCSESSNISCYSDLKENTLEVETLLKENWIPNFKPRKSTELVQNCSNLDRNFLEQTVQNVANILLQTENYISLQRGSETFLWNSGGSLKLSNLIRLVDPLILKNMKNQCGGFQTFLRNHRNVFSIKDGDVQLTVPSAEFSLTTKLYGKRKQHKKKIYSFKEKQCYFFFHHPQGCPLEDSVCNFSHKK